MKLREELNKALERLAIRADRIADLENELDKANKRIKILSKKNTDLSKQLELTEQERDIAQQELDHIEEGHSQT
jgi:chromosome segregation ATPase